MLRLKSIPNKEGTEFVPSDSSGKVVGLFVDVVLVVLPSTAGAASGSIWISKGIVILAMLGAVTVGKVTLGRVTLTSLRGIVGSFVVSPTSLLSASDPLVSPETRKRSKLFEDLGCSLKKLGSVTRVVVGAVLDDSVVTDASPNEDDSVG